MQCIYSSCFCLCRLLIAWLCNCVGCIIHAFDEFFLIQKFSIPQSLVLYNHNVIVDGRQLFKSISSLFLYAMIVCVWIVLHFMMIFERIAIIWFPSFFVCFQSSMTFRNVSSDPIFAFSISLLHLSVSLVMCDVHRKTSLLGSGWFWRDVRLY